MNIFLVIALAMLLIIILLRPSSKRPAAIQT